LWVWRLLVLWRLLVVSISQVRDCVHQQAKHPNQNQHVQQLGGGPDQQLQSAVHVLKHVQAMSK